MGSMISVGETVDSCDRRNPAGEALLADMITGNQSDNYIKQMRYTQHEHSKESGLTMEQIECLLESLAEHYQSLMVVGADNEKQ
ncbi:hypothetical protein O3M35_000909 [Rhynocoris fuscipes]